jgi:hypothetical protein
VEHSSGRRDYPFDSDLALYNKVSAYDRVSTVLLGDPTVSIPVPT